MVYGGPWWWMKALGALLCVCVCECVCEGPGASEQSAAAGWACSLTQDAVLLSGQSLDQTPEVFKGDSLSRGHAHLAQDLTEATFRANALAQVGQLWGQEALELVSLEGAAIVTGGAVELGHQSVEGLL